MNKRSGGSPRWTFTSFVGPLSSTVPSGVIPLADAFLAVRRQRYLRHQMGEGGAGKSQKDEPGCGVVNRRSMRLSDLIA